MVPTSNVSARLPARRTGCQHVLRARCRPARRWPSASPAARSGFRVRRPRSCRSRVRGCTAAGRRTRARRAPIAAGRRPVRPGGPCARPSDFACHALHDRADAAEDGAVLDRVGARAEDGDGGRGATQSRRARSSAARRRSRRSVRRPARRSLRRWRRHCRDCGLPPPRRAATRCRATSGWRRGRPRRAGCCAPIASRRAADRRTNRPVSLPRTGSTGRDREARQPRCPTSARQNVIGRPSVAVGAPRGGAAAGPPATVRR